MKKIFISGAALIVNQRVEQLTKHGRTIEDDIRHNDACQLCDAASALINCQLKMYPKDWNVEQYNAWMKKSRVEQLEIAGALIAAEIDRIQLS